MEARHPPAGLGHEDSELVGVILAREDSVHDLPDGDEGRIAGVVVDKLEAHIHRAAVIAVQQDDVVARLPEHRLEQFEVNGRHLRTEQGITGFLHLLGELGPVIGSGYRMRHDAVFLAHIDGGDQRPDADACRAEVVDLVDFEQGIELADLMRISATSSVVTASTPQPKELSCTRSRLSNRRT